MSPLQGKAIWTLYDDINLAVTKAPEVGAKYIICKVSQRGRYSPTYAQNALAAVRVNPDLIPIAYSYSYLEKPALEAECVNCALRDGFAAFIIDAEADTNLKFLQADQFADQVLALGIDTSKLYLCSDPRLDNKMDEIPYIQFARVCKGGFMPMIYGEIMPTDKPNAAARMMKIGYDQYERHKTELGYTLPLMPAISTCWDGKGISRMTYTELKKWTNEAEARFPTFVSLFRASVVSKDAWKAFKEMKVSGTQLIADPVRPVDPVNPVPPTTTIVPPGGPGFTENFYNPAMGGTGWTKFTDKSGYLTFYRNTSPTQTMYATYQPALPAEGRYLIEVFIPGTHATTKAAQYHIVYYDKGVKQERAVPIPQINYSDVWVSLGAFDLNPVQQQSGRVNLVDMTPDSTTKEIAFSTIRWRTIPQGGPGFDAPIGTLEERAGLKVWPGNWVDANPYPSKYGLGYHTGADLNLNIPVYDSDKHSPVYAAADGTVTFAEVVPGTWNGLIVIEHAPLPDGKPVYSRYGHVEQIAVNVGDVVKRGQQIAVVGLFGKPGTGNYHLHFDISCTTKLAETPRHWPGFDLNQVLAHYVDPKKFILEHRP